MRSVALSGWAEDFFLGRWLVCGLLPSTLAEVLRQFGVFPEGLAGSHGTFEDRAWLCHGRGDDMSHGPPGPMPRRPRIHPPSVSEFRFYTPGLQLTGTSAASDVTIEARLRGSTKWMIAVATT